jgi:Phage major capsid protein E
MPTRQQIHIDRALTNISVAYMQDANNFIADKVFPIIPVQKQSDTYFIYDKEDFFRDEAAERAKGTESAGGDYDIDQAPPYFAKKWAFHMDVTEEDRVNADDPLKPNQDATEFVSQKLLLRRENLWAQKYFQAGVWGTEVTGVASAPGAGQSLQWDQATADPIDIITKENTNMASRTGYKANTLVLSPYVMNALKNHPDVLDRIKYTQKGIVTLDLLATLFEVEHVYVPWAVQNSAIKGKAANMNFIMGKHALLMYVEKNPGLKKPSAGYTFAWTGLKGAGAFGNRIVRIPMPWLGMDTERVEGEMAFDLKVVGADLGTFFKDIVS